MPAKIPLTLRKCLLLVALACATAMTQIDFAYVQAQAEAKTVLHDCYYDPKTSEVRFVSLKSHPESEKKLLNWCWPDVAHEQVPDLRESNNAFTLPEGETELLYLVRCWSDRIGKRGGEIQQGGLRLLMITKRPNGEFACSTTGKFSRKREV